VATRIVNEVKHQPRCPRRHLEPSWDDSVVTWTLAKVDGSTRLRVVHSAFILPKNATAFRNLSEGWKKVVAKIDAVSGGHVRRSKGPSQTMLDRS